MENPIPQLCNMYHKIQAKSRSGKIYNEYTNIGLKARILSSIQLFLHDHSPLNGSILQGEYILSESSSIEDELLESGTRVELLKKFYAILTPGTLKAKFALAIGNIFFLK